MTRFLSWKASPTLSKERGLSNRGMSATASGSPATSPAEIESPEGGLEPSRYGSARDEPGAFFSSKRTCQRASPTVGTSPGRSFAFSTLCDTLRQFKLLAKESSDAVRVAESSPPGHCARTH